MTQHYLAIPGPTPLPDAVREALAEPAIGHRSPEFKAVLGRVLPALRWAFQIESPDYDVLLYTASGTGAMEAALVNTLNPGDAVLGLSCGVFSARWCEIAETLGLRVSKLEVAPGEANTVESLQAALDDNKNAPDADRYKAVMLTHSETSTGVLNPIAQMLPLIQAHGALSVVDAVTSLLASDVPVEAWQADLVVSGSQKGFMCPPGLSFLSVSPKAWAAHQHCLNPRYYFNFSRNKKAQDGTTTAYTPATALIRGLDEALKLAQAEGLPAIFERHRQLRDLTRSRVRALGLELLVADDTQASFAATAVKSPAGVSVDDIRKGMKQDHGIVIADGQKELKGQIFRIGHLGYGTHNELAQVLNALETVINGLR